MTNIPTHQFLVKLTSAQDSNVFCFRICSSAAPVCYLVYSFWVLVLTNQVSKLITLTSKLSCFVSLARSPLESRASKEVFGSLSSYYKELKLTTKLFAGRTLCGLLIQMQNISLRSSGMHRKQNFEIVFGFKSDTAVLTFTFRFLSSPLFSLFLPHCFFSCWAFSRLHFGGKGF